MAEGGQPVEGKVTVVLSGPPKQVPVAERVEPRALVVEMVEAQRIGRFELIRELARGGMGQVFLARDIKLGRRVAVKFLLHADPRFVDRFVIEAQATARCTHDNIVTIFEVGEHQGLPFMVLEYLEGKTLAQRLEQGIATRELVDVMIPVVRALECAHTAGIVHRDLKPSNIFVTDQGAVKVLDFGVAKCSPGGPIDRSAPPPGAYDTDTTYVTFSDHGSFIGTAPYMSPEQWGADTVDHASDIWALGIMFWRALAGVHPVSSTAPETLRAELTQLDKPLPSIATRVPELAPALVAIIDRCVAKTKAARYASATQLLADLVAFVQPETVRDGACPYRGLAAFGEGDSRYFFGRANETRTAIAQLDSWPLLAVLGPSGAGKSSFVHAGLIPAIRASGDWNVHVLRPGRAPLANLANAMSDRDARIHEAPGLFGEALREEAAATSRRVLLVVDQLEELFTLCDDEAARATFLAALMSAADDPSSPVRVVVSMRADYLDRLATHKPFFADVSRGLCFLSIPSADALRETIVRPAEMAGYTFEDPWIVDDMLQATSSRGALPLLQFAATRLWEARDERRELLTVAAYNQMGGVGGAFSRHAEDVASGVPSSQQPLLRAIMMRLVTSEGTRAVVDRSQLASLASDPATVEDVLDHLVRARLVHLDTELSGGVTVELVHDVLITEWPTLRRWLDDDQAARVLLHELGQAAKQWEARGRPGDLVWRGATAKDSLAIVDRAVTLAWSASEREFIAAIRAQLAKTRRRRMVTAGAIVSTLVLLFAAGAIAVVRISNAEQTAVQKAVDADAEAQRARTAEAETARQLELVKAEENRRRQAEAERASAEQTASRAKAAVALSREELERANADLQNALTRSQQTEARAREAAVKEREASAALTAANARLGVLLEQERARARAYETERKNIATKLKSGSN